MGRFLLSKAHDWQLENSEQDIRGWKAIDRTGKHIGNVEELIADTDTEMVESMVLDTGQELPARDVDLVDGIVYAEGYEASETADAAPTVRKYQSTRIRRGEGMGYAAHEEIFRRHHAEASDTSDDYAAYRPAYEYGYTYGNNPEFAGRDYAAVEPELRQDYERHHGSGSWGRVKAAARHAFEYARR